MSSRLMQGASLRAMRACTLLRALAERAGEAPVGATRRRDVRRWQQPGFLRCAGPAACSLVDRSAWVAPGPAVSAQARPSMLAQRLQRQLLLLQLLLLQLLLMQLLLMLVALLVLVLARGRRRRLRQRGRGVGGRVVNNVLVIVGAGGDLGPPQVKAISGGLPAVPAQDAVCCGARMGSR